MSTVALSTIVNEETGVVDAAWLSQKMAPRVVLRAGVRPGQEKMGGMSAGEFRFLDVVLEGEGGEGGEGGEEEHVALALKQSAPSAKGAMMGLAREAFFYAELAPSLSLAGVPRCYFAEGDMATGEAQMLIECLTDAVPAGVFFGAGNPNNWAVKARLGELCAGNPSPVETTRLSFSLYAQLHAAHWQSAALFEKGWLRGADWYRGEGEAGWAGAQQMARAGWEAASAQRLAGEAQLKWDSHLVACLDASFGKVSWADFQAEKDDRPFAFVHGDAHPHNALWTQQRTDGACLRLIDFEMVGVASPAQELGQYTISHMAPELRRAHERELVAGYHAELVEALRKKRAGEGDGEGGGEAQAAAFTLEACWAEYVAGGVGRWVWFLPMFWQMTPVAQFFHDQLAQFLKDHVADPANMPMPRV